jgi:hypothetical protein
MGSYGDSLVTGHPKEQLCKNQPGRFNPDENKMWADFQPVIRVRVFPAGLRVCLPLLDGEISGNGAIWRPQLFFVNGPSDPSDGVTSTV